MVAREPGSRIIASWCPGTTGTRPGNSLHRLGDYCIELDESRVASEGPKTAGAVIPEVPENGTDRDDRRWKVARAAELPPRNHNLKIFTGNHHRQIARTVEPLDQRLQIA